MPLTPFQREVLATLTAPPNDDRYLAGGAALHFAPHTERYSDDLDFFHDSEERVAGAFAIDRHRLDEAGYTVEVEIALPGFVRALVGRGDSATRIDWAHDSAWRFMPLVRDSLGGLMLHPLDLAINKALALAGRDEPRDFVDILYVHRTVLPLAGLVWAAVGKDPGFSPLSLLELLKRRGRYRPEEFGRLHLATPFDPQHQKVVWLAALADAIEFANSRAPEEAGCLYYAFARQEFMVPANGRSLIDQGLVKHFGAPGGVLPRPADATIEFSPEPASG